MVLRKVTAASGLRLANAVEALLVLGLSHTPRTKHRRAELGLGAAALARVPKERGKVEETAQIAPLLLRKFLKKVSFEVSLHLEQLTNLHVSIILMETVKRGINVNIGILQFANFTKKGNARPATNVHFCIKRTKQLPLRGNPSRRGRKPL
jgi:hypothetical protein